MKWTFSVPVWGDWYVKTYLVRVLPYHERMDLEGRYIIHTNRAHDIEPHLGKIRETCEVELRTLPGSPDSYDTFALCHNEVFRESSACMFLTADMAFSEGAARVVREMVERGAKLIAMHSTRTLSQFGDEPPFDARGMNEWAVNHMHVQMKTCIWGRPPPSFKATNLYFEDGESFWTRGFHLHPLAAVRDSRRFDLSGTVDGTLVTAYWPNEAVVIRNHEIAALEFTPESRAFDLSWNHSHPQYVADCMRDGAKAIHRHFFTHSIALRGEPSTKYDDEAREIYARL